MHEIVPLGQSRRRDRAPARLLPLARSRRQPEEQVALLVSYLWRKHLLGGPSPDLELRRCLCDAPEARLDGRASVVQLSWRVAASSRFSGQKEDLAATVAN
jgi:hypothetical protein